MFGWFKRWLSARPAAAPAPASRPAQPPGSPRTAPQRVSVVLPEASLASFERDAGRRLAENERYGVAKMALLRLFDTSEQPEDLAGGARIDEAHAREYLQVLDL